MTEPTHADARLHLSCRVPGCRAFSAIYEVFLYDDSTHVWKQDDYCPFICHMCAWANDATADYRCYDWIKYRFTKPNTPGATRYKRIATGRFLRREAGGFRHLALAWLSPRWRA